MGAKNLGCPPTLPTSLVGTRVSEYTDYGRPNGLAVRDRPKFIDQVGHQTTNASIGNKYFSLNIVIVRLTKIS